MGQVLHPAFVAGSAGRLFVSCFAPAAGTDRWLLFVPPFAEEANKSRRMIARLGYALAERGLGLCLPDLYGTGDSEGDFADARLDLWQEDLTRVADWLRNDRDCEALYAGGLRLGVPLALSAQDRLGTVQGWLCWHPMVRGQQQLTQFLRLRQAAAVLGGEGTSLKDMQASLADGQSLEVAGYTLAAPLAQAMSELDLQALSPLAPAHWLELTRDPQRPFTPASRQVLDTWQQAGSDVTCQGALGDPFWAVQELVDAPALVDASVTWLLDRVGR